MNMVGRRALRAAACVRVPAVSQSFRTMPTGFRDSLAAVTKSVIRMKALSVNRAICRFSGEALAPYLAADLGAGIMG